MMRSLSSGVAGLRTHQTKMDVVGNNIANVNTFAFKASRTTFADVYYQNLGTSNKASAVSGGTNPTQIGYGSSVATIEVMNNVTGMTSTDRALDVYLAGEGFLVSRDSSGKTQYSRLGNMFFDAAGNLVDGNGQFIQGFPQNADGTPQVSADGTITAEKLTRIHCDPDILDRLTGIQIGSTGGIVGILPGDMIVKNTSILPTWTDMDHISVPPDSNLSGDLKFMMGALPDAGDFAGLGVSKVEFGDTTLSPAAAGNYTFSYDHLTGKVTFKDTAGKATYEGTIKDGKVTLYDSLSKKTAMTLTLTLPLVPTGDLGIPTPVAVNGDMVTGGPIKYQVTTTDKGENIRQTEIISAVATDLVKGEDLKLDELGVTVTLTEDIIFTDPKSCTFNGSFGSVQNDESTLLNIGNIVIAKFRNPTGMQEAGSNYFNATNNSGEAIFVKPGIDGTGSAIAGALEMSNVDLAKEFTDMITTQRGFQANSRIITVSDEMLQELVNLKR